MDKNIHATFQKADPDTRNSKLNGSSKIQAEEEILSSVEECKKDDVMAEE